MARSGMLLDEGPWSPWILAAGDERRPFAWRKGWRVLPFYVLVCSLEGTETLHLDGQDLAIGAGRSYLVPPGMKHAMASPGSRTVFLHAELAWHAGRKRNGWERFPVPAALGADPSCRQPGLREVFGTDLPVLVPEAWAGRFRTAIPEIVAGWLAGGILARAAAGAAFGRLLLAWAADPAGQGVSTGSAEERLARAEAAAIARLGDGGGMAAMVAASGWGRSRFCAVYRRLRGTTPAAFLRDQRLRSACGLLADSDLGLAAIARRCGYADVPGFIRAFRTRHDCTPGAWRSRRIQDG